MEQENNLWQLKPSKMKFKLVIMILVLICNIPSTIFGQTQKARNKNGAKTLRDYGITNDYHKSNTGKILFFSGIDELTCDSSNISKQTTQVSLTDKFSFMMFLEESIYNSMVIQSAATSDRADDINYLSSAWRSDVSIVYKIYSDDTLLGEFRERDMTNIKYGRGTWWWTPVFGVKNKRGDFFSSQFSIFILEKCEPNKKYNLTIKAFGEYPYYKGSIVALAEGHITVNIPDQTALDDFFLENTEMNPLGSQLYLDSSLLQTVKMLYENEKEKTDYFDAVHIIDDGRKWTVSRGKYDRTPVLRYGKVKVVVSGTEGCIIESIRVIQDYGNGALDEETTRIEFYTEFYNGSEPTMTIPCKYILLNKK
jgi:hypothetical protein